jgi:hypothetical protein
MDRLESFNNNIVIGIIGAISDVKGMYILCNIIEYYKNNDNVQIILFGYTNIPEFKTYKYNTIAELNELLILHKPNVLLDLSLWTETYSYTLSLSMITRLPIIYLKKTGLYVIEDRLKKYNSYPFTTMSQLNMLVLEHKQDYFYTIYPVVYFNSYWNECFHKTYDKNVVIISSKIIVSSNAFSYSDTRSIYTTKERYEQTLNTIKSIKKYIPNFYIIFIDNSILPELYCETIKNEVDVFINDTTNKQMNYYTNIGKYKAYGEISQLYNVLPILKKLNIKVNNIFKISGRYIINDKFRYTLYNNDKNIFKHNIKVTDRLYYYTSFYKIKHVEQFIKVIEKLYATILSSNIYDNMDLEVLLPVCYDKTLVSNLGITQYIAVWNQIDKV